MREAAGLGDVVYKMAIFRKVGKGKWRKRRSKMGKSRREEMKEA